MGQTENVKIRNVLHRIGDGAISGIGILIVGSLAAFLWTTYSGARQDLGSAKEVLEAQIAINGSMKEQVERLTTEVKSLRSSVEANRLVLERTRPASGALSRSKQAGLPGFCSSCLMRALRNSVRSQIPT